MRVSKSSLLLAFYLSLLILNNLTLSEGRNARPTRHRHSETPALFIFGDSFFDVGNNEHIKTYIRVSVYPYGSTFFKRPTGRSSNGRLIPDFIAEYAKLPLLLPYLDPAHRNELHIQGVNFASGGAGALFQTNQGMVVDLGSQANHFIEVSKQLREKLGDEKVEALLSRAVYIFSIGGNDYATHFAEKSRGRVFVTQSHREFIDFVNGNITATIEKIYNEGGRKFGFINVAPMNCLPFLRRNINRTTVSACLADDASGNAWLHNDAFPKRLQKLEKQLNGFKYSITNFYAALVQLLRFPTKYGFKDGGACCGSGPYRGDFSCGKKLGEMGDYELCDNFDDHVFFDCIHPSEKAFEHVAKLMWNGDGTVTHPYNLKQLFHDV